MSLPSLAQSHNKSHWGTKWTHRHAGCAAGIYSFCFAGHAVFVSPLYTSMAKRADYNLMLYTSFSIALTLYVLMASLGVAAFGAEVQ